jgi:hypothetical protein
VGEWPSPCLRKHFVMAMSVLEWDLPTEVKELHGGCVVSRGCVASGVLLVLCRAGLSNAAPVIYFPGALIYSAGFNVN